jgi:hypothetical protein
MTNIIDSCPIEHSGSYSTGLNKEIGQSFTGDGEVITSCAFYLFRSINPVTGTLTASVYAHSGTYGSTGVPTGDALATSMIRSVDDIPEGVKLIKLFFVGDQRITLTAGTKYFITLAHPQGGSGNYIYANKAANITDHDGNGATKAANWTPLFLSGEDFIFYIYKGEADPRITGNKPFKIIFH